MPPASLPNREPPSSRGEDQAELNRAFANLAALNRDEHCKRDLRLYSLLLAYQLPGEQPETIQQVAFASAFDSTALVNRSFRLDVEPEQRSLGV